ncbi:MAG: FHA domain-containing protein, partial [Gammaproteobacteria bacterium]
MRCLLRAVVRRSRGVISHQDRGFEGDHLTIGRSTDQDLELPDLRVALHHATVVAAGPGRFVIQSAVPSGIRHNDEPVQSAFLEVGDQVSIGDHRITVRPLEGAHDLVLEIAQVRADPGQEVEKRVASASGSGPQKGLRLGVRGWSWILSMTILALFFVVPLVAHQSGAMQGFLRGVIPGVSDHAWSTGGLTEGHRYFGDDCNKCHERAFVSVRASACAECHKDQPHHFDVERFKVSALADKQCAACHKEHGGAPGLTRQDEGLCLDCHRDMKETAADSKLLDIRGGFADEHPEFRATFVTHVGGKDRSERIEIDRRIVPKERSNLFFPHKT